MRQLEKMVALELLKLASTLVSALSFDRYYKKHPKTEFNSENEYDSNAKKRDKKKKNTKGITKFNGREKYNKSIQKFDGHHID